MIGHCCRTTTVELNYTYIIVTLSSIGAHHIYSHVAFSAGIGLCAHPKGPRGEGRAAGLRPDPWIASTVVESFDGNLHVDALPHTLGNHAVVFE